MVQRLYCVYDRKAKVPFNGIFQQFNNDEDASRLFSDVVMNPQSGVIHKHPEDFALMYVGDIDNDTLHMTPAIASPVVTGDACVRAVERARAEFARAQDEAKRAGVL